MKFGQSVFNALHGLWNGITTLVTGEAVGGLEGNAKIRPQLSARLSLQDAMTGSVSAMAQMGGRASVGPRLTGKVRIYPE